MLYREATHQEKHNDNMRIPAVTKWIQVVPVEPCEHGNYAEHIIGDSLTATGSVVYSLFCDGAALKEGTKEGVSQNTLNALGNLQMQQKEGT